MTTLCPDGHPTTSSDYCDVCGLPVAGALLGGAASSPPPGSAGPAVAYPSAPAGHGPSHGSAHPAAPPSPYAPPGPGGPGGPDLPGSGLKPCPNCGAEASPVALFCENCGYDFTTGALPPPPAPDPNLTMPMSSEPANGPQYPQQYAPPGDAFGGGPGTVEWVAELWVDPDWYATQETSDPCPSPGMPTVVPLTGRSLLVGRRSVSRNITPQVDCGTDSGVSRRHAQLTTDGQRWWVEDLQSSNGTYLGQAAGPLPSAPLPPGQKAEFMPGDRIYLGAWTRLVVRRATEYETW